MVIRHKLCLIIAALALAVPAAAKKPPIKRPVVCLEFQVVKTASRVVALCTDGKAPRILVRFVTTEVPVAENDTDTMRVAIGYTSAD